MIVNKEPKQPSALDMAMAVLMERINNLPKDDKNDLYELSQAVFTGDAEESNSAARAMREILDQGSTSLTKMKLDSPSCDELDKWIDYVSERIRTFRKQAKMTQVDLAKASGLPQSHISRLENAEHSPSFLTLEKIAKALSIPVSELDPSA